MLFSYIYLSTLYHKNTFPRGINTCLLISTTCTTNPKLRPLYYWNFIVNGFHKKHREKGRYNTQKRAWFIERIFLSCTYTRHILLSWKRNAIPWPEWFMSAKHPAILSQNSLVQLHTCWHLTPKLGYRQGVVQFFPKKPTGHPTMCNFF